MNESFGGDSSFDYRSLLPSAVRGSSTAADTTVSIENEQPDDVCSFFPEMTWRERLLGFGTCMVAGYLLSFGSFWRIKDLLLGNPIPFVLNATVGNIIALMGSFFLSGPKTQLRKMWHECRRMATTVYLGSLAATLFVAFVPVFPLRGLILILLILVQYVSLTWYCLSYIPYAREAVSGYVQRRMSGAETSFV